MREARAWAEGPLPRLLFGFDGFNDTEPSRRIIDAAFQFARRQLLGDK